MVTSPRIDDFVAAALGPDVGVDVAAGVGEWDGLAVAPAVPVGDGDGDGVESGATVADTFGV